MSDPTDLETIDRLQGDIERLRDWLRRIQRQSDPKTFNFNVWSMANRIESFAQRALDGEEWPE